MFDALVFLNCILIITLKSRKLLIFNYSLKMFKVFNLERRYYIQLKTHTV